MRRYFILFFIVPFVLLDGGLYAQTVEQDRRIEEEKRESLKPTVVAPHIPKEKVVVEEPPVPLAAEEIYLINLFPKRIVYRYDAAKAVVILMGVDEEVIDLGSQVAYLQEKGFLPQRYQKEFDPMQPLRKGLAAYLFQQALGIEGGIALHLFGPSERYALKELVFRGMISPGHVNDIVSGQELVLMMTQAARYKLERKQKAASTEK